MTDNFHSYLKCIFPIFSVMVNKLRPFTGTDTQTNFKKIRVNHTHGFDFQKSIFFTGLMPSTTSLYVILKSRDCRRGLILLISDI